MNGLTEKIIAQVEALAQRLLESEGLVLVDVEFRRERHGRILRIVMDKDGGVTLDDCTQVSRQLGDLLDVKLVVDWPYNLEVSSPGLDRPLTKERHFNHFKGRQVVIWTRTPIEGKSDFKGKLMGISDGMVILDVENGTKAIPYDAISKARLDF